MGRLTAGRDLDGPAQPLDVLSKRSEFLRAARGKRVPAGSFLLQAYRREDDTAPIRVGFTCSKKVGNAVARARAKRRLREIARTLLPLEGKPGWDYVLVGRPQETIARPYPALLEDLNHALKKVHG